MIRVLIVDDQEPIRDGLGLILGGQPGIEVVGLAADGREAVRMAAAGEPPDVVLMDIRMPGMDGIEATRSLLAAHPDGLRVLVLTTFDLDEYVYAALRAGASGFLLKRAPREELIGAVRVIAAGEALLAPSVTRRLLSRFTEQEADHPDADTRLAGLTDRETEVLRLIAAGMSNAEIAVHLVLSEHTVKTHVRNILTKTALRDRVQAAILAYDTGLVQPRAARSGPPGQSSIRGTIRVSTTPSGPVSTRYA